MKTLHQKILDIYSTVTSVVKDDTVSTGQGKGYKAVSHDAVTKLLHGPLTKAGIVVLPSIIQANTSQFEKAKIYNGVQETQLWYKTELTVEITFVNADKPDDKISIFTYAYAIDSADKATGKALSMAVKNAYLKLFMLESLDHEEARDESFEYATVAPTRSAPTELDVAFDAIPNHAPTKAPVMQSLVDAAKATLNVTEQVIETGKYAGRALSSIPRAEVESYVGFFAKKDNVNPATQKVIQQMKAYLG
jgi:uncharacterized protein (DUF3820 family)